MLLVNVLRITTKQKVKLEMSRQPYHYNPFNDFGGIPFDLPTWHSSSIPESYDPLYLNFNYSWNLPNPFFVALPSSPEQVFPPWELTAAIYKRNKPKKKYVDLYKILRGLVKEIATNAHDDQLKKLCKTLINCEQHLKLKIGKLRKASNLSPNTFQVRNEHSNARRNYERDRNKTVRSIKESNESWPTKAGKVKNLLDERAKLIKTLSKQIDDLESRLEKVKKHARKALKKRANPTGSLIRKEVNEIHELYCEGFGNQPKKNRHNEQEKEEPPRKKRRTEGEFSELSPHHHVSLFNQTPCNNTNDLLAAALKPLPVLPPRPPGAR